MLWEVLTFIGWETLSIAPLVMVFGIWLSGGLHHDGLMDTADGLAAGPSRRLEAMEDSRVGASGVLALLMLLLIEFSALTKLGAGSKQALLLACFWGRVSPLWAIARFEYIRKDGSAAFHSHYFRPVIDFIPALLGLLVLTIYIPPVPLLLGAPVSLLSAQGLGSYLGGHTGDSYGAVLVLTHVFTLIFLALAT